MIPIPAAIGVASLKAAAGRIWARWYLVAIAALAVLVLVQRDQLAGVRADRARCVTERAADATAARAVRADAERRYALQLASATELHAGRLAAIEPIIIRSTDTVRTYAQTDAGRARCLGPDRVRGIDALDRDLADAAGAAPGGADAVPADAGTAPD